jgi:phage gp36-like protein
MSYSTIDDVFAMYPPINTAVGSYDNQVTSLEVSSRYIANADSLMDSFLAKRYAVPVPTSGIVTMISADLSIFAILVEKIPQVPDYMQKRYDRAMELLKWLADGTIVVQSATTIATGDQEAWSTNQGYHPIFSPVLSAEEQRVDQDRHDADKAERDTDCPT